MLEQPYALTLWTFYQITERERIHALRRRIEVTDNAVLTSLAYNEPQKISVEQAAARDAAKRPLVRDSAADDAWRAAADRLTAAVETGNLLVD